MRRRRSLAWLIALSLVTVVLQPTPAGAAPTVSTPITYVYDEIGRLTAVVDPTAASNGIAKYAYDDVGNLLSITRQSATTTRILEFHGKRGGTGTPVTIYGSSFNTTAAQNQVRFNGSAGTIATVTAATATTLQVSVPAGAADGPLWVKNLGTNKTATSTASYDVIGSVTPTVSGFSPTSGDTGVQIVINGTNFDPSAPARNNVFFNGTRAQVVSATASALTVKVPPFVAPGKISVQTADGEAVSSADFTAPPQGFVATDIESTTRLSLGQTSALTVNTANKVAIGLFDGQQNHELFIDVTGATTALYPTVRILDPFGRLLSATPVAPTGGTVPTQLLPFDGTYTIMFDPQSTNTGQLSFKPVDATHSTTAIVPGGAGVPFSTTTMGQDAWFTFDGTVGQRISAMVTSSTYPCCPWIRLFEPTGRDVGGAAQIAASSKFFDVQTLTWPGRHYFEFDPSGKDVGSAIIQVYDVPADPNYPIAIGGSVVTGSNTVPGQNFTLTFTGTTGQNLTLTMSGGNLACCNTNKVKVLRPDGSVFKSGNDVPPSTQSITSIVLDTTGTHTISYDLRDELVGTRNFQLTLVSGFAAPGANDASEPSRSGPVAPTDEPPASTGAEVVPWPDAVELPALEAEPGVTALAGRVLRLDGSPLQHVSLEIDGIETESDATGRFLLAGIPAGKQVLEIDGATANSAHATYGFYEAQVHLARGETNELGWTIWMTELDLSTTVRVPDVLDREVVLRTPDIPGFEVHIPEGSRLIGEDGEPVNELSLTAIPVDRPPFPLPPFGFPMYFTVQPGGTYVEGDGAWVVSEPPRLPARGPRSVLPLRRR
ncbi:MAG: IPT/TIG domain-containing protein [Actinomycetota bacterium]